jgi:hypothetical protein
MLNAPQTLTHLDEYSACVAFIDKYEPKRKDPAGDTSMRTPFDEVHSKLIAKVRFFSLLDCLACADRRWFTEEGQPSARATHRRFALRRRSRWRSSHGGASWRLTGALRRLPTPSSRHGRRCAHFVSIRELACRPLSLRTRGQSWRAERLLLPRPPPAGQPLHFPLAHLSLPSLACQVGLGGRLNSGCRSWRDAISAFRGLSHTLLP